MKNTKKNDILDTPKEIKSPQINNPIPGDIKICTSGHIKNNDKL